MSDSHIVLVTGGAGYIGSVLTRKLVENGFKVKVLDSLVYGEKGIYHLVKNNMIELIEGDIRDKNSIDDALKKTDFVIHLAAIVGEHLCKKIPKAAKQINETATSKLIHSCKQKGIKRFVYASTCSNYGSSSEIVDEKTPLQSLSLYSETKVNSENNVLASQDSNFEPCVLRFATAFGLSPRMRFDLLLQEFIRDACIDKKIVIYGSNFWRPLVHINDISNACIMALKKPASLISGQVYNVGDTNQNYTKIDLAKLVQEFLPSSSIEIHNSKKDPRNYKVSFEKIKNKLGFKTTQTVRDGVLEIVTEINNGNLDPKDSEFSNMSKLTEKVKVY